MVRYSIIGLSERESQEFAPLDCRGFLKIVVCLRSAPSRARSTRSKTGDAVTCTVWRNHRSRQLTDNRFETLLCETRACIDCPFLRYMWRNMYTTEASTLSYANWRRSQGNDGERPGNGEDSGRSTSTPRHRSGGQAPVDHRRRGEHLRRDCPSAGGVFDDFDPVDVGETNAVEVETEFGAE